MSWRWDGGPMIENITSGRLELLLHKLTLLVQVGELLFQSLIASLDVVLVAELRQLLLEVLVPLLDLTLFCLEGLYFLALAFPRGLGGPPIAENPFHTALLRLIFGLCSLSNVRVSRHIYNRELVVQYV